MKFSFKFIAIISVFLWVNNPVYSQNTNDSLLKQEPILINEIVVTAQSSPTKLSKTSKVIHVIDSEDLKSQPIVSIDQALRTISSIDIRQRGTYGVQSDVSIRGGHYEQTLIMLNGVSFNDPQTGHFNLNLPVDFESLNRIEIIQGSATRTLGANAMSGAINMIVKPENRNFLRFSTMFGQHLLNSQNLRANFASKKSKHLLSLNRSSSEGYIENTDFNKLNAYYFGNIKTKKGNFEIQTGYNQREFGANSFYSPRFPNQFEANEIAIASIRFESNTKIKIIPLIYWRYNTDRFELFRNKLNAPAWYTQHNYHKTYLTGASISSLIETKFGKTSVGLNFRNEEIYSTVLGNNLEYPIPFNKYENINFTKHYSRSFTSLHFNHNYSYRNLYISAGLMADINSDISNFKLLPGADIGFALTNKVRLFASSNKSMRMPSFTDLFYKSPTIIGNPNLTYEEATTYETGLKYFGNSVFAQVSLFNRQSNNLIDWIKYPQDSLWRSENLTKINFKGAEFSSLIYPSKINENLKFIKKLNLAYTYLYVSKINNNFESAYALDQLKHKANLSITFNLWKNAELNYSFSYFDRYGSYLKFENNVQGVLTPYNDFTLSDIRFTQNFENWNLFFDISNIFNKKYYDFGNIIQPGRWIRIGAAYTFNLN